MNTVLRLLVIVFFTVVGFLSSSASGGPPSFGDAKTNWHGFDRYDFLMDEADLSIKPHKAAADEGNAVKTQVKGQLRCVVVAPKAAGRRQPVVLAGLLLRPRAADRNRTAQARLPRRLRSGATPASRGTPGTRSSPRSTGCRRSRRSSA